MNDALLGTFIEAYAEGLRQAVEDSPRGAYALQHGDTSETYALRVALTVHDKIQRLGLVAVLVTRDGFRNACKTLGIDHTEVAIQRFLDGQPTKGNK